MGTSSLSTPHRNRLLQALPPEDWNALAPNLHPSDLPMKAVLFRRGDVIDAVHFPVDGVVSLVAPLTDGAPEVAAIGNEGIVGIPLVHGGLRSVSAVSPVGARVLRMDAATFLAEVDRRDAFRRIVDRYMLALFAQITTTAACNRLHTTEERMSRWLLTAHDRVGVDTFPISHDYLAQMLGTRRATVTLSARLLAAAGLIRYHRARVTIADRDGLETAACECYALVSMELAQVLTRQA
jgi:CRP-like cAMP-binding protein